jgi:hypothetical protein
MGGSENPNFIFTFSYDLGNNRFSGLPMVGDLQFTYCMQQDKHWGVIAPLVFDPCLNCHMAKDEVEIQIA